MVKHICNIGTTLWNLGKEEKENDRELVTSHNIRYEGGDIKMY
jgi:hypothetical protein